MSIGHARVRIFVVKEEPLSEHYKGFEVLRHEVFENRLLSSPVGPVRVEGRPRRLGGPHVEVESFTRLTDRQWIEESISYIGWDGVGENIAEILEPYAIDDVVEILADYVIKGHYSHSWEGDDYDEDHWLENEEHNKLRDVEITRFIGPFKRNKDGLIEFDNNALSFNHGIQEN